MTEVELVAWYAKISKVTPDDDTAADWITEAESALAAVFPDSHPVRSAWAATRARGGTAIGWTKSKGIVKEFEGIFASAERQLKEGRLRSITDGIRVETVGECLEVADALLGANHVVAAMVIAGGALEVHLRHLCGRFGVLPSGNGSISTYNDALSKARNAGTTTISASDSKSVTAWGGRRNDAAHSPTTFAATVEEVRLIVEGIRQFIARTQ
jgi:hypothetical protein